MSKTVSGSLFIGGAIWALLCAAAVRNEFETMTRDVTLNGTWVNDIPKYLAMVAGLVGVGVCFFGAMRFSRGS